MATHQALGPSDFGPFESAFDKLSGRSVPGYLALLGLRNGDEVEVMRRRVVEALQRSEDSAKDILRLFSDVNWRPHLVGCIALLESKPIDIVLLSACWAAADCGSWVTPQLLATLRLADPDFVRKARAQIDRGFVVTTPGGLSALERHSATGPAGTQGRMAKFASACIAMLEPGQSFEKTMNSLQLPQDMVDLIEADTDNSASIALRWYARANDLFLMS